MTSQVTTQFWPLFPCQSDGQEAVRQKGLMIKNSPNSQQLDRTPNAQGQADYYRLIDRDEPKHMDWRKKLGGMLLREIGGKENEDKWTQCILYNFPDGYTLYEHIKSKADGTKTVKNHSGGGHDRQDAYLYGHPKGPKKRFRSPVEFFPHLLWLSTDESRDHENCSCKLCCPVQLEPEKPVEKVERVVEKVNLPKTAEPAIKKEITATVTPPIPAPAQAVRNPVVPIPVRRPSGSTPSAQSPALNAAVPNLSAHPAAPTPTPPPPPAPAPAPSPAPATANATATAPSPSQLPQIRSVDQQVDSQYGNFLARTGEVVWFHRDAGAWGLGTIIQRWIPKDGSSNRAYLVQPLSHPFDSPAPQIILDDSKLKPWLAWSAPGCTYPFLQQNTQVLYEQVDWQALLSGRYGDGNPEVDASILAAKKVDTTYTLIQRVNTPPNSSQEERHWNGMYFGAEKIWNGEPVRIHDGNDLMVITSIIECVQQPAGAAQPPRPTVQFVGDIYTYAVLPVVDPNSPPQPPSNSSLPVRMNEDLRWRNQTLIPATRCMAYWKLTAPQQRIDISEVKGRWYETSLIFPDAFQNSIRKKEGGNGVWMNSRGDATGVGKVVGIQTETRIEAFSTAVPKGTVLVEGLDAPAQQEQSKPPISEMPGLGLGVGVGGNESNFALDDFMNLEGMDGDAMNFDDHFNFT